MLREIRLYGELGRQFGRVHRFAVASAAEAIRALCVNFKGFEQALRNHPHGFHVLAGRADVADKERLHHPAPEDAPIKIIPVVAGAKSAWVSIIIGVVLIAAAFFTGGASLGGFAGFASQAAFSIGATMVLGGISRLMTPTPNFGADTGSDEQKQSKVFSGPINTSAQGVAVPIVYGRLIVGSATVSVSISTRDIA